MKLQDSMAARKAAEMTSVRGLTGKGESLAFDHWLRQRLRDAFGNAPANEPLSAELDAVLAALEERKSG